MSFRPFCEFRSDVASFVALGILLQEIGEEEQLQHHENDKKFDEDDGPQRLAQAHVPETINVEVVDPIEKVVLSHRQ